MSAVPNILDLTDSPISYRTQEVRKAAEACIRDLGLVMDPKDVAIIAGYLDNMVARTRCGEF